MKNTSQKQIEENNPVSYREALEMIEDYKRQNEDIPGFLASEYFEIDTIKNLLSNPRCKGIRVFNAISTKDNVKQNRHIIMGIDENGKVILNYSPKLQGVSAAAFGLSIGFDTDGIVETGNPCPPYCRIP